VSKHWPLVVCALAFGCAAHKIPGTDIDETADTDAIIEVVGRYNTAVDAQDAAGILALVDKSFYDDAGTLTPEDDLDYATLQTKLPAMLKKFQDVGLKITVKTLNVSGDKASLVYNYVITFRIGQKVTTDSDIKRMDFKRVNGVWKIVKGV
jgi:ketosteroid isomerase-like protein